jgi:hypothetical protein
MELLLVSRSWHHRYRRLRRLLLLAFSLTAVIVAPLIVPLWLQVLVPRWVVRGAAIAFLWTTLVLLVAVGMASAVGGLCAIVAALRAVRRRDRCALLSAFRWTLLASSCLAGLFAMELSAEVRLRWSYRFPDLPTRFAKPLSLRSTVSNPVDAAQENPDKTVSPHGAPPAEDELYFVVAGESSARGEPYQPWLSVAQIVAWQLEQIFPGRHVRVDIRAQGGLCLEQAILQLCNLNRRPDGVIVFAGQNEFQTRYGWSRNVRHYVDEGPESPLALIELARSTSSTAKLILETLDRYRGEAPPAQGATRELIDHPTCTPKEYAFLLEDFRRRLDLLTAYCEQIGALPILIVPASNDGSYEPNRSVLAGSTGPDGRAEFAREFDALRKVELLDCESAIKAYNRLVKWHPEFAETHYRLARLFVRTKRWDEARLHFTMARDLDGLPLRCPTAFREAYRSVARRYHALLIDGEEVLARLSPHAILDDRLFHDGQHVNLAGYVALAQEVLEQLRKRRAFGWPASTPVPSIALSACARHFRLDAQKFSKVCTRSADFYQRTAFVRFDPSERLRVADQYLRAARELAAGHSLDQSGIPSMDMAISIPRGAEAMQPAPNPSPSS